ncbi:MAG: hypothetical protein ACRCXD_00955 [Luteolibacter sp.]
MTRPSTEYGDLSETERRDPIMRIEQGRPLPDTANFHNESCNNFTNLVRLNVG